MAKDRDFRILLAPAGIAACTRCCAATPPVFPAGPVSRWRSSTSLTPRISPPIRQQTSSSRTSIPFWKTRISDPVVVETIGGTAAFAYPQTSRPAWKRSPRAAAAGVHLQQGDGGHLRRGAGRLLAQGCQGPQLCLPGLRGQSTGGRQADSPCASSPKMPPVPGRQRHHRGCLQDVGHSQQQHQHREQDHQ